MKFCRCEVPRPSSNPRRTDCNRCGFRLPPASDPPPIMHHCARCHTDLAPGHSGGMFWKVDPPVAEWLIRLCPTCCDDVLEYAVTYREPQH